MILKRKVQNQIAWQCIRTKKQKLSWQTSMFQRVSFPLHVLLVLSLFLHWLTRASQKDTIYGRHKTSPTASLLVQSCISSKRMKGEIEQKVHSWGLMVKGNQLWTRLLKRSPDLCLLMCIKFPHLIVATRVKVYSKFSSQRREKLIYSEE